MQHLGATWSRHLGDRVWFDSFSPTLALLTPTDIGAEDPPEEEFRRRRQNTLPSVGFHQRCLRNAAQSPSEEEEEHNLTRGPPMQQQRFIIQPVCCFKLKNTELSLVKPHVFRQNSDVIRFLPLSHGYPKLS